MSDRKILVVGPPLKRVPFGDSVMIMRNGVVAEIRQIEREQEEP